ncbi:phosphate/phosphite/phosphonate ABC transporter substrate-binding protein [Planktothrix sp. FACHB-1355]|uniref:Phosphate/phosphite/phosphonate ABC transporter substrate-binding protein n=1 Tax=Aerosakkonema funiforme FACHB-1375 TaxID=2949571 RepID=A0A926ZHR5_9CYAN|nr:MULTISPECIES: phosphate/phosphite/phosphonate ABC transporter substrate-binding protein [Oscillatoriales]MBD2183350.1 phosphate/phosphite/phosphonate ABC transporter substrate-binding protein [Aerosakkonema funiforme FACHB-1375]MBD3560442.1 phosphate/phosphite/phosphonate ABC transporter substrate-binding protein [Planktothrix sp. FACHB-1355]
MLLKKNFLLGAGAALVALFGITIDALDKMPQARAERTASDRVQQSLAQATANRLTIVLPTRGDAADAQRKANAVAQFLSRETGMSVEAMVADETAAVEALRANRADVAFLSSRPALKAEELANARLYLAEVRPNYSGGYTYRSVFVVPSNSPLRSGATAQTLQQLRGKKMAFTSPTSGSGFIFPVGELVKLGLVENRDRLNGFFGQVSYGNNYSGALQAVLRGQADVAAVSEYALKPPYITQAEGSRLRVLYAINNVPAHGVSIDDDVPVATREKIINALMKLNEPANNQLLRDLYNSTQLVKINHTTHLQPMRDALQRAGIQL